MGYIERKLKANMVQNVSPTFLLQIPFKTVRLLHAIILSKISIKDKYFKDKCYVFVFSRTNRYSRGINVKFVAKSASMINSYLPVHRR